VLGFPSVAEGGGGADVDGQDRMHSVENEGLPVPIGFLQRGRGVNHPRTHCDGCGLILRGECATFISLTHSLHSLRRDRSYIITERREEKKRDGGKRGLSGMEGARGRHRSMVSCKAHAFSCQKLQEDSGEKRMPGHSGQKNTGL
jgi:hypothetical protein